MRSCVTQQVFQMVYTRSQKSSLFSSARGLLSLKTANSYKVAKKPAASKSVAVSPSSLWSSWTTWYHAFLSEVTDETPFQPIAARRSEATSRWTTFCAKQLRCSESHVRAWLRTADQKALVAAYA